MQQAATHFAALELTGAQKTIAEGALRKIAARLTFLLNVGLDYEPSREVTAPSEPLQLGLHELRQQAVAALLEPLKEAGEVPAHEHRGVAVVGLSRDVDARPRARGHDARLCIRTTARLRSPRLRDCCRIRAARRGALTREVERLGVTVADIP
ncbi:hypothetical protein [Nannocystis exedens]|uniref:hypothetical protein n=1 Tax=Nannocystis exedens TaxID=54 RepID=UPI000A9B4CE6|nr:hypothetical protein [Nannocystis exedens]